MQTEEIKKSLNGGNHKDSIDNAITSVISRQDNYSRGYSGYQLIYEKGRNNKKWK